MPQCRGLPACQLFLQAAVAYTLVHCTRSHHKQPACGQEPCAPWDTQRHTHTHLCAEANPQKPVITRPTPARCVQWFMVNHCLFNSITRGSAAGLASYSRWTCIEGRPLAAWWAGRGQQGLQTGFRPCPGTPGDFTPTQSFPCRNHFRPWG